MFLIVSPNTLDTFAKTKKGCYEERAELVNPDLDVPARTGST